MNLKIKHFFILLWFTLFIGIFSYCSFESLNCQQYSSWKDESFLAIQPNSNRLIIYGGKKALILHFLIKTGILVHHPSFKSCTISRKPSKRLVYNSKQHQNKLKGSWTIDEQAQKNALWTALQMFYFRILIILN